MVVVLVGLTLGVDASARLGDPAQAPPAPEITAARPCFGAAARDATLPACRKASRSASVEPTPKEAPTLPNSPCNAVHEPAGPPVCWFGVPEDAALRTIALVGDSHAGHWRGAMTVVARRHGWHGLSITHSSCPLQKALRDLPEPKRTSCRLWKRKVFAWFERHPEVSTVFVAGLTGGSGVVRERGLSEFATRVRSYERAWDALPATVKRIVVIRDTPKFHVDTNRCVERAVRAGRGPGPACARARAAALDQDPAIAAARRRSEQVRTVDLTHYFCDARRCFPVVGGALVLRDNTHVTGVFSSTLGPYLDEAVSRLDLG